MINTWSLGFYLIRAQPPLSIILLLISWSVCGGGGGAGGAQLPPASTIRARLFQFWLLVTTHHTAETISPLTFFTLGFPGDSDGGESARNAGDLSSIPRSGISPGEENDNPLQYSCLENPMDRGAWRATKSLLLLLLSHFSCVQLCATPWTAAQQAPVPLGFSRQEHWSGFISFSNA